MIDKKNFWLRNLADPGFLILPNGLTGPSTTYWIRPWSNEGRRGRAEWFCTEQYDARFLDIFIWFEEESVKKNLLLFSSSYRLLSQKLQTENIVLPVRKGQKEEAQWNTWQEMKISELHLQEAEKHFLKDFLSLLGFILLEIGFLETPESYTCEMKHIHAIAQYVEYGFCYVGITKL